MVSNWMGDWSQLSSAHRSPDAHYMYTIIILNNWSRVIVISMFSFGVALWLFYKFCCSKIMGGMVLWCDGSIKPWLESGPVTADLADNLSHI